MKLYCLSGLGVDRRAFQNIKADGVELIHIDWIDPLPKEALEHYAKRLFNQVNPEDGYNLLGVSFGGMIATEFAKIKHPNKLFLISTINNRSQLNLMFKIGSALMLHKLIPTSMARRSNFVTNYLFSVKDKNDKQLLTDILRDTDPVFLKWAMNAITKWNNNLKPKGIVIHGSKDRMLPLKQDAQYIIDGGGHFMIVNRADEISKLIFLELNTKEWKILKAEHEGCKYRIEEDKPEVGWYVYRFDENGKCTHDYLQNTEKIAIEFAEERFGVPQEIWKGV